MYNIAFLAAQSCQGLMEFAKLYQVAKLHWSHNKHQMAVGGVAVGDVAN